jgi:hypothetical protein
VVIHTYTQEAEAGGLSLRAVWLHCETLSESGGREGETGTEKTAMS